MVNTAYIGLSERHTTMIPFGKEKDYIRQGCQLKRRLKREMQLIESGKPVPYKLKDCPTPVYIERGSYNPNAIVYINYFIPSYDGKGAKDKLEEIHNKLIKINSVITECRMYLRMFAKSKRLAPILNTQRQMLAFDPAI